MKFGEVTGSKITKATTKTPSRSNTLAPPLGIAYVCTITMVEESSMQKNSWL